MLAPWPRSEALLVPVMARPESRVRPDSEARPATEDPLSAESRLAQRLAPPPEFTSKPEPLRAPDPKTDAPAQAARTLDAMLPALVERIAWHAEGKRGAARLELGGLLVGTSVLVQTDGGRVRVQMEVPAGADADRWRERLEARLERAGLDVTSVEVRNA